MVPIAFLSHFHPRHGTLWVTQSLRNRELERSILLCGASDRMAATVTSDPVSPGDLLATVYRVVGIDPETTIHDLQGRPFPLVSGKPVEGLLA